MVVLSTISSAQQNFENHVPYNEKVKCSKVLGSLVSRTPLEI